jgi:hypothetical protein
VARSHSSEKTSDPEGHPPRNVEEAVNGGVDEVSRDARKSLAEVLLKKDLGGVIGEII